MHDLKRSDEDVVNAVLDGDTEAFALLVRRYQDVLYAHAVRMVGSPDDATDLVQRALVTGFRRLRSLRDRSRVGGWLFRILSNLTRDHLRRREAVPLAEAGPLRDEGPSPVEDAERTEVRRRVEGALARLDPEQREAFVLKHLEGRRYREMAELVDASVPALKMRVHRAREALEEMLEVLR